MVSIQKIFFWKKLHKKLQSQTILFPYKLCVSEKRIYVYKQIEIPYSLMVLLSMPLNKLPCIATRSMMNGESSKIDPQTLKARKALAEKLKAEVIGH